MDIVDCRCCLCPNYGTPARTRCPPGPLKKPETPCRFAVSFFDESGARVFVSRNGNGWLSVREFGKRRTPVTFLPARKTFDEAQRDLNGWALGKGWKRAW